MGAGILRGDEMKLKIEKPFKDKYTGKRYELAAIVEFETARAEELLNDARGLVSKPKAKRKTKKSND